MTIHKEGFKTIIVTFLALGVINFILRSTVSPDDSIIPDIVGFISFVIFALVVNFFRSPKRVGFSHPDAIIAPADGKVVVIEEVYEGEYLKEKRLQVSIFMSPFNVHINSYAINGVVVKYFRHHSGAFMKAYLPKIVNRE